MMFSVKNTVKRFPTKHGWYYIEIDEQISKDLRPVLKGVWPALLRSRFTIRETVWSSSIMPIKNGPLFIALPAKVRKEQNITIGDEVVVSVEVMV